MRLDGNNKITMNIIIVLREHAVLTTTLIVNSFGMKVKILLMVYTLVIAIFQ